MVDDLTGPLLEDNAHCAHVKSFLLPAGDNIILFFSPVSFFRASKSIKNFL